jgi:hypothetical protein
VCNNRKIAPETTIKSPMKIDFFAAFVANEKITF